MMADLQPRYFLCQCITYYTSKLTAELCRPLVCLISGRSFLIIKTQKAKTSHHNFLHCDTGSSPAFRLTERSCCDYLICLNLISDL